MNMKDRFKKIPCETPEQCRFKVSASTTTCMYFPPVYNREGKNLNPDRNITTSSVECINCGRRWSSRTVLGESTFEELTFEELA